MCNYVGESQGRDEDPKGGQQCHVHWKALQDTMFDFSYSGQMQGLS